MHEALRILEWASRHAQVSFSIRGWTRSDASDDESYRGGVNRPSAAVQPPSTIVSVPVTNGPASDARQTTAPAISCLLAQRPSALFCAYASYPAWFAAMG